MSTRLFGPPALDRKNLRPGGARRLHHIEGALAPVGYTGAEEIRRVAADAGHTPASFRRLILAYGYADAEEVPTYRFQHLRSVASDPELVAVFSGAVRPDEREHAITEQDGNRLRFRLLLANASDERLHLYATAAAKALAEWSHLKQHVYSDEAAERLRLVTDEMAFRLRQYAELSALRDSLSASVTGIPPGRFGSLESLEVGNLAA